MAPKALHVPLSHTSKLFSHIFLPNDQRYILQTWLFSTFSLFVQDGEKGPNSTSPRQSAYPRKGQIWAIERIFNSLCGTRPLMKHRKCSPGLFKLPDSLTRQKGKDTGLSEAQRQPTDDESPGWKHLTGKLPHYLKACALSRSSRNGDDVKVNVKDLASWSAWTLSHLSCLWFSGSRQALWKDYLQIERSQPLFSWLPPFLSPTPLLLRGISHSHFHSHPENEATKSNQPCRVPFFCLNGKCKNKHNLLHRHKAHECLTIHSWDLQDTLYLSGGFLSRMLWQQNNKHFLLWKCHFGHDLRDDLCWHS